MAVCSFVAKLSWLSLFVMLWLRGAGWLVPNMDLFILVGAFALLMILSTTGYIVLEHHYSHKKETVYIWLWKPQQLSSQNPSRETK